MSWTMLIRITCQTSFLLTVSKQVDGSEQSERENLIQGGGRGSVYMYFYPYNYSSYYRSIREDPYWTSKKNS